MKTQNVQKLNVWIKTFHTSNNRNARKPKVLEGFGYTLSPKVRIREFYLLLEEPQPDLDIIFRCLWVIGDTLPYVVYKILVFYDLCLICQTMAGAERHNNELVSRRCWWCCCGRQMWRTLSATTAWCTWLQCKSLEKSNSKGSLFHSVKFRFCVKLHVLSQKLMK